MVNLSTIKSTNATLANESPLTAVFVGATTGIGEYTLRALVRARAGNGEGLRIYLAGRNEASARKILDECAQQSPQGRYYFIQTADLSLLHVVDKAAADISQHLQESGALPRVDFLFLSQGGLYLGPRNGMCSALFNLCPLANPFATAETNEGLDFGMAMHYYSRARFTYQLLPLLRASAAPHVIWIYAAGLEGALVSSDLSLRDSANFTFANVRSHCVFMATAFMEMLAAEERKLGLVHVFPGLVVTPAFWSASHPLWLRVAWRLVAPIAGLFSVPTEESGERMLFLASERFPGRGLSEGQEGVATGTDGVAGSGAYAVNNDGEPTSEVKRAKALKGLDWSEMKKVLYEHTIKAFDAITKEGNFEE